MYFDRRLWAMMAGLRLRVAGGSWPWLACHGFRHPALRLPGACPGTGFRGRSSGGDRMVSRGDGRSASCCAPVLIMAEPSWHRPPPVACSRTCGYACSIASQPLAPAGSASARTGGVMLAVIDGVEQLQTFFGAYLPQLIIAACAPVVIFSCAGLVGRADGRGHARRRPRDAGSANADP